MLDNPTTHEQHSHTHHHTTPTLSTYLILHLNHTFQLPDHLTKVLSQHYFVQIIIVNILPKYLVAIATLLT